SYFSEHLKAAKAYPTLMTTNLMAPEAYVMKAFINAWCMQKTEQEIHQAVGEAYHKYQKCGIRGAKRLFRTAWDSEE
ncbi:MAG: hypothetical protein ACPG5P_03555, partial [Saprospiraceae bacterium]